MDEKITYFAQTNFRNKKVKFGVKVDDRRRHIYIIGKTGMGKSQLLENMIISDIRAGFGVCVVDPHGDLVEGIIECMPRQRIKDLVYFNPADIEHPIAFNVLENVSAKHRPLVADGVVGVFKKIWAESWGPRMEYILRNAIFALLEDEGSTLLGVVRILTDRDYRQKVLESVTDPVIRYFWTKEFSKYPERDIATIIGPIQNKVGQYLSNAMIRNIVGQTVSTINIREIMDTNKILLMNLSKGRIGEDTSNLLGSLVITKIQLAAMSRVDIKEKDRKDFYLYIDELQNFATESFGGILSEARKYHLNMTMAHQYVEQLPEALQAAVWGNVGTIISFRIGAGDAEYLAKEFAPTFLEEDFVNLPKFHVYLKLMINGVASEPFSASTLAPIASESGYADEAIEYSRKHYTHPLEEVEKLITEWWDLAPVQKKEDKKKEAGPTEVVKQQIEKLKNIQKQGGDPKKVGEILKQVQNDKKEEEAPVDPNKFDYATVDWHNIVKKTKELSFDGIYYCDVCSEQLHLEFEPRLDKPILCYKCVKKRDKAFKREKREREEARQARIAENTERKQIKKEEVLKLVQDDRRKKVMPVTAVKKVIPQVSKAKIVITKNNDQDEDLAKLMSLSSNKKKTKVNNKREAYVETQNVLSQEKEEKRQPKPKNKKAENNEKELAEGEEASFE